LRPDDFQDRIGGALTPPRRPHLPRDPGERHAHLREALRRTEERRPFALEPRGVHLLLEKLGHDALPRHDVDERDPGDPHETLPDREARRRRPVDDDHRGPAQGRLERRRSRSDECELRRRDQGMPARGHDRKPPLGGAREEILRQTGRAHYGDLEIEASRERRTGLEHRDPVSPHLGAPAAGK
jgi:hypothetical protein